MKYANPWHSTEWPYPGVAAVIVISFILPWLVMTAEIFCAFLTPDVFEWDGDAHIGDCDLTDVIYHPRGAIFCRRHCHYSGGFQYELFWFSRVKLRSLSMRINNFVSRRVLCQDGT